MAKTDTAIRDEAHLDELARAGTPKSVTYKIEIDERQRLVLIAAGAAAQLATPLGGLSASEHKELVLLLSMLDNLPDEERVIPGCTHVFCC